MTYPVGVIHSLTFRTESDYTAAVYKINSLFKLQKSNKIYDKV